MLIDTVGSYFCEIFDSRTPCRTRFTIVEVLTCSLVAFLTGHELISEMDVLMKSMPDHLKEVIGMDEFPSGETIRRVTASISPQAMEEALLRWAKDFAVATGDQIAIDGKKAGGSIDGTYKALQVLSAWSVAAQTVVGVRMLDSKQSEIPAARELIKALDINGQTVTLDALHCQTETAKEIIKAGGDYILGVKGNQKTLRQEIEAWIEDLHPPGSHPEKYSYFKSKETQKGREEVRQIWVTEIFPRTDELSRWKGLKSLVRVESKRIVKGEASYETRYFITSLPANAEVVGGKIRAHWSVENGLHLSMDVTHREDWDRTRDIDHLKNRSIIRRIADGFLTRAKWDRATKRGKMAKCLLRKGFLRKVLSS